MLAGLLGLACGAALAILPFGTSVGVGGTSVALSCRAPVLAAWNREPRGLLQLWAVSRDGGSDTYEVRSGGDAYCARIARRRLLISATSMAVGVAAVGTAFRLRQRGRSLPTPAA